MATPSRLHLRQYQRVYTIHDKMDMPHTEKVPMTPVASLVLVSLNVLKCPFMLRGMGSCGAEFQRRVLAACAESSGSTYYTIKYPILMEIRKQEAAVHSKVPFSTAFMST
jgi:hypothetical protein